MSDTPQKRAGWLTGFLVFAAILGFLADVSGLVDGLTGKSIHELLSAGDAGKSQTPKAGDCTWTPVKQGEQVGVPPTAAPKQGPAVFTLDTNRGRITIAMDRAKTPCAVASLAFLSSKDYFANSKCHRMLDTADFKLIQCGDPTATGAGYRETDGQGGPGYQFAEENLPAGKSPTYPRGTVAMAKTSDPGTTGSQFFVALSDLRLPADYTMLGDVTQGMKILDSVLSGGDDGAYGTGSGGGHPSKELVVKATSVA